MVLYFFATGGSGGDVERIGELCILCQYRWLDAEGLGLRTRSWEKERVPATSWQYFEKAQEKRGFLSAAGPYFDSKAMAQKKTIDERVRKALSATGGEWWCLVELGFRVDGIARPKLASNIPFFTDYFIHCYETLCSDGYPCSRK